jgi:carotenoid cleavage dioxygenase-like enzyme
MGSSFRRYTVDIRTAEITYTDTLTGGEENVMFPTFNPTFAGKKNCYSYITELFFIEKKLSIVKVDHCQGTTTRWNEPGVWMSEPYFVDDPTSDQEDAGYIMVSVFDDKIGKNRFLMIDAETMQATSDTELPMRIPMSAHSAWFPSN